MRQSLVLVYRFWSLTTVGTIETLSDLHFEKIALGIYVKCEFFLSYARKLPVHLPNLP